MSRGAAAAISAIGVGTESLAASAHALANLQTVRPAGEAVAASESIIGVESSTGGVQAVVTKSDDPGVVVYDPKHPFSTPTGLVRHPGVDMAGVIASSILAANLVKVNVVSLQTVQETYRDVTNIVPSGRSKR
jgi:flagellar basal body rod protein FlgC